AGALSLADVQVAFEKLAGGHGISQKLPLLEELLGRARPLEAKYIVKIITGDLRIGLKESLVVEAIAHAFNKPLAEVERANMLVPLRAIPGEFILDGEIVGWRDGRAIPFTDFQKRLGRKQPGLQPELWPDLETVPAAYIVFDLLYSDGELLLDVPLTKRRLRL